MLLAKGADIPSGYGNALYASSDRGNEAIVRILLLKEANTNALGPLSTKVLEIACRGGDEHIVQRLLDSDAKVTSNAIMVASRKGHQNIVQMLLDRGAGISLP